VLGWGRWGFVSLLASQERLNSMELFLADFRYKLLKRRHIMNYSVFV
jgi:hypothetical protein